MRKSWGESEHRSSCAIAFGLDTVGDKWSLIIVRDIALRGKISYGEFLRSEENIATNILSNRLLSLQKNKIIVKKRNTSDKRKDYYGLTKKGVDLFPVLLEMLVWGAKYFPENQSPKWFVDKAREDKTVLLKKIRAGLKHGKFLLSKR